MNHSTGLFRRQGTYPSKSNGMAPNFSLKCCLNVCSIFSSALAKSTYFKTVPKVKSFEWVRPIVDDHRYGCPDRLSGMVRSVVRIFGPIRATMVTGQYRSSIWAEDRSLSTIVHFGLLWNSRADLLQSASKGKVLNAGFICINHRK